MCGNKGNLPNVFALCTYNAWLLLLGRIGMVSGKVFDISVVDLSYGGTRVNRKLSGAGGGGV